MSSGIIMRNGIQYGNAVLNKADEILTDDNKTVQDELNNLKTSLNDITNVVEITSGNDISKLKEGLNAVKFTTGVVVGTYTTSNNCRGIMCKNGNVVTGMISSYNSSEIYWIATDHVSQFSTAKKL